jgi:hypothetical protein
MWMSTNACLQCESFVRTVSSLARSCSAGRPAVDGASMSPGSSTNPLPGGGVLLPIEPRPVGETTCLLRVEIIDVEHRLQLDGHSTGLNAVSPLNNSTENAVVLNANLSLLENSYAPGTQHACWQ